MPDAAPSRPTRTAHFSLARSQAWIAGAYAIAFATAWATVLALPGRDPLWVALAADLVATAVVFAFSVAMDNSSMYDPYWSIAPIPIVVYWALAPGGSDAVGVRQAAVVLLVVAWGLRLTANQMARWHGLADEDYRYVDIRRKTGKLYWPASLLSLHVFPTALVFLGLVAAWPALSGPGRPLGWLDALGVAVGAAAILLETVADLELRRFMSSKRPRGAVLDTGIWAWCRHPNYLGEMGFWWGLWILGFAARPAWWAAIGPVAITLLFTFASIPMKDRRMLENHPEWAERMKRVPALLPRPPRR
jgi:steroid 5-alpha reductase family enzyme